MVWSFVRLSAWESSLWSSIPCSYRQSAGSGCFGAEYGELVTVRHPQIRTRPSRRPVDTTRAGLRGGGKGVGSMHGLALPVVGVMCPSRIAGFSS